MDGRNAGPGFVTDTEEPIFVDQTGQRRRLTVLAGAGIAVGLLLSLALILAGLFSGSPVPLPGWPDTTVQQGEGTEPVDPFNTTPTPGPPGGMQDTPSPQDASSPTQPGTQTTSDGPGAADPSHPGLGRRPSKSPGKPK